MTPNASHRFSSAALWIFFIFGLDFATAASPCDDPLATSITSTDVEYQGISFARTNRALSLGINGFDGAVMDEYSPSAKQFFSIEYLKGKRVLDAGSGQFGRFVEDLRKYEVDAVGIDLATDENAKGILATPPYLFKGDLTQTNFQSESFDVVISTQSLLTYASYWSQLPLFLKALKELKRVVKVGGIIVLSPISLKEYTLVQMFEKTDGLKLELKEYRNDSSYDDTITVILRRTH